MTIAALIAGGGLYGVLATSARQRTAEIGVRMALGAVPSRIFRLMVGKGVLFLLIAVIASWLPAERAAGLDPTTALRSE